MWIHILKDKFYKIVQYIVITWAEKNVDTMMSSYMNCHIISLYIGEDILDKTYLAATNINQQSIVSMKVFNSGTQLSLTDLLSQPNSINSNV